LNFGIWRNGTKSTLDGRQVGEVNLTQVPRKRLWARIPKVIGEGEETHGPYKNHGRRVVHWKLLGKYSATTGRREIWDNIWGKKKIATVKNR